LIAGCAAPAPELQPDPPPAVPPPAVLEEQTARVLGGVSETIVAATNAGSVDGLGRIAGVASEMRTAEFAMHAADPEQADLEPLGGEFAGTMIPATSIWPRSLIAVTVPSDSGAQYLYLVTQTDPRTPYALTAWVRLLAGVTLPETAPADVGSLTVAMDAADGLTISPGAALAAYAEVKDAPGSPNSALFAGTDPARDAWTALVERWGSALAPIDGTVRPSSSTNAAEAYALATADGGAIAVGVIRSSLTLEIPGDTEGQSFSLAPYFGALGADNTIVTKAATIEFVQPVALAIPAAGSEAPVSVLGVSQVPVSARTAVKTPSS
jgi:hypothetical protein